MNALEILGLVFLAVLVVNLVVWIVAIKNPALYKKYKNLRLQNQKEL